MTPLILHSKEEDRIGYMADLPPPLTCWPDETQQLLLQACLCDKKEAEAALRTWLDRVDILKLDHGSNRLMALLSRNLEKHGIHAGLHHERLRGNWRRHWYHNKIILNQFHGISKKMEASGIPVLALKGIPLALFYYQDMGARPMSDFDILIHPDQIHETVALLSDEGYEPKEDNLESKIAYANGCGFTKKGVTEIDLHWHVLHDCFYKWSDDAFWEGSVVEKDGEQSCRTLCPEDHLLHVCAHGMRYNKIPPLRWLADAWVIVKKAGDRMDYDRLNRQAERRQLASPLKKTFDYFQKNLFFPGDRPVCAAARRLHVSFYEKLEYPYRIRASEEFPSYVPLWFQYQRWKQADITRTRDDKGGFLSYYAERRKHSGPVSSLVHIILTTFKPEFVRALIKWIRG